MRPIRRGDRGPAVVEIRSILVDARSAAAGPRRRRTSTTPPSGPSAPSSRAAGSPSTARSATRPGARSTPPGGASAPARSTTAMPEPLVGDDVRTLQERLLEMGYDVGRADGIFGARTARAVAQFQREVGLTADGACGPQTMHALRRLGRKVVGGRPQWLREAERVPPVRARTWSASVIVIDPGHGGADPGIVVPDGPLRWTEADLAFDLAARLEGRLAAAGMRVHLTRGPGAGAGPDRPRPRAELANELGADLLISLHIDGHANPEADGVATYHYGTEQRRHLDHGGAAGRAGRSGRSSRAPGCATAGPTPRPGSCCG